MDNKIINYRRTDEYRGLCDELVQSCVEFQTLEGEFRIKFKYSLASTIVNSPAYAKFAKGNQDFLEKLAGDVRRELGNKSAQKISRTSLYDALQVYEAYPSEKKLLEALAEKHEPVFWSSCLRLIGREQRIQDLDGTAKCNYKCPRHCLKSSVER